MQTESKTKLGLDQIDRPAPLWFRRLTNAMLVCFVPGFVLTVQSMSMGSNTRNTCMVIATAIPFLMKGFGMIMGNGQFYSPSNDTIDKQKQDQ